MTCPPSKTWIKFEGGKHYNSNRPHVLNSVGLVGGGSRGFSHDQNGNMTQGDGESITYNAFNKPLNITGGSNSTAFTYGADLMRYKQITPSGSTILYLDKLMEIESSGSAVDYRHYLGDVAILTKTGSLNDPSPGIACTFRDRLGGISMLGSSTGTVTEYRGYDTFGKPRNGDWTNKSLATINSAVTDRGFTDHEHLDDWQLIHMNGRGYDYNLGRFLSVDPFIQDPGNSQSTNPYAYILNNPLSGTDPSGYCTVMDTLGDCFDSLDAGITQDITNEDGDVVGFIGKDSDANLYYSGDGSENGRTNVQGLINANDRSLENFDITEIVSNEASLVIGLQQEYEQKGFFGKFLERLSNGPKLNTNADDMLERLEYCLPNCNFGVVDAETAGLYTEYMIALGTGTIGSMPIPVKPRSLSVSGGTSVTNGVLNPQQAKNLARFNKKKPANSTDTVIRDLPGGGKAFQADSAARSIPGSFARFEKQIDSAGKTTQFTKTTFGPKGEIVHVKDKITGQTFVPGQ